VVKSETVDYQRAEREEDEEEGRIGREGDRRL
jgi:hypothetical protein